MRIAGLTLAKNCVKYKYPIAEMIKQHKDFFDTHFIGVPKKEQDIDGTIDLIKKTAEQLNILVSERICEDFWTGEIKTRTLLGEIIFV